MPCAPVTAPRERWVRSRWARGACRRPPLQRTRDRGDPLRCLRVHRTRHRPRSRTTRRAPRRSTPGRPAPRVSPMERARKSRAPTPPGCPLRAGSRRRGRVDRLVPLHTPSHHGKVCGPAVAWVDAPFPPHGGGTIPPPSVVMQRVVVVANTSRCTTSNDPEGWSPWGRWCRREDSNFHGTMSH